MAKERRVRFEFAVGLPDHTWHLEEITLKAASANRMLLQGVLWREARETLLARLTKAKTETAFVTPYHVDWGEEDE